jgi:hypothetical protein
LRASSLSNTHVIELINRHFVAVHLRNQDFAEDGIASAEEKRLKQRVYREALEARLPAGTVCVYLLSPDARPIATAPLNQKAATDPEQLAELLQQTVGKLRLSSGDPLIPPAPLSPPACQADAIVLRLTARYLDGKGGSARPLNTQYVLGSQKGGNWGDLPSQDWIVLSQDEWTRMLPAADVQPEGLRPGALWTVADDITAKLLTHFYPPTENTDNRKNRIDEQTLTARVESVQDGRVRARLEGRLLMKHPFYHKDDSNFVSASLIGYLDFERGADPAQPSPRIHSLLLVTDEAQYGDLSQRPHAFGVVVTKTPEE